MGASVGDLPAKTPPAPTQTFNVSIRALPRHVYQVFYVLAAIGVPPPRPMGQASLLVHTIPSNRNNRERGILFVTRFPSYTMAALFVVGSIVAALLAGSIEANDG